MSTRHRSFLVAGSTHRLYLPSLDGARGLAILLVLLDHLSSAKIIPFHLRGIGLIGVCLFFSLSAFLLTAPFWLKDPESLVQSKTWSIYFWRRGLRIYPLYLVVLLTEHFAHIARTEFSWLSIRDHLLLRRGEGVFWTMEVETKYYLVLPLLVLAFLVAWRRNAVAGLLCMIGLAGGLALLFRAEGKWWSLDGHVLRGYFWVFFLGSAAGSFFAFFISRPLRSRGMQWFCEAAAVAGFLISFSGLPEIWGRLPLASAPSWWSSPIIPGVAWAVFLAAHLHGIGFVKYLLEWRPLRYLGLISYSVYLWHKPVITCLGFFIQTGRWRWVHDYWVLHFLAILGAVISWASLSFFLIERPFSTFKARFTRSV